MSGFVATAFVGLRPAQSTRPKLSFGYSPIRRRNQKTTLFSQLCVIMYQQQDVSNGIFNLHDRQEIILPGQVRIYARKSIARERAHRSIDEQVKNAMRQCERMGLPVSAEDVRAEPPGYGGNLFWVGGGNFKELSDGKRPKRTRPELTRLVNEVIAGLVKVVVVWDYSRLWRSTEICAALVSLFHMKGVLLLDRAGFADLSSPEGRKRLHDTSSVAQEYRELCAVNIDRSFNDKRETGESIGIYRCLGYAPEGRRKLRAIPAEIALVNRIFVMYVLGENGSGPMAMNAIASQITEEGLGIHFPKSTNQVGGRNDSNFVYTKTIAAILRSPRYIGKQRRRSDGQLYDAYEFLIDSSPAVSPDLWQRAQERIERRQNVGPRRLEGLPASGLLRCGVCGKNYFMSTSSDRPYVNKRTGAVWQQRKASYWRVRLSNSYHNCKDAPPSIYPAELDQFLKEEFLPMLRDEVLELQNASRRTLLANRIQELRLKRSLQEGRLKEFMRNLLSDANSSSASTLARVKGAAEDLIQEVDNEIFSLEYEQKELDESSRRLENLAGLSESMFRDVLRSIVVWIAVLPSPTWANRDKYLTKTQRRKQKETQKVMERGRLLVLTSWGTYHSAVLECGGYCLDPSKSYITTHLRNAHPWEQIGTVMNLPDPERFVANIRREQAQLRTRGAFRFEIWAPGFRSCDDLPVLETEGQ